MILTLLWGQWTEIANALTQSKPTSTFLDTLLFVERVFDSLSDHTPVTLNLDIVALSHIYQHTNLRFRYGAWFDAHEWEVVHV